jgi:hypothetical protein
MAINVLILRSHQNTQPKESIDFYEPIEISELKGEPFKNGIF